MDPGGEVTAIDSAGFGPINITKAVTITSPDGVEAGIIPTGGGDAIDINAGPNDVVVLRGLTLNGSGVGGNGIVFNSGGSLTVTNCVVQNFENEGIQIQSGTSTTVYFAIINTLISNNRLYGIDYHAANFSKATGVIDHVAVAGGQNGIALNGASLANGSTTDVAVSNSVVSNNRFDGIFAGNGSVFTVSIDNATVNGNGTGIHAATPATVRLSRSVIQGNGTGTVNNTNPANTFYTYGNNLIASNGTDFGGTTPLNTTDTLH